MQLAGSAAVCLPCLTCQIAAQLVSNIGSCLLAEFASKNHAANSSKYTYTYKHPYTHACAYTYTCTSAYTHICYPSPRRIHRFSRVLSQKQLIQKTVRQTKNKCYAVRIPMMLWFMLNKVVHECFKLEKKFEVLAPVSSGRLRRLP